MPLFGLRNLCVKIRKEIRWCEGKSVFLQSKYIFKRLKGEDYENNEINKRRGFEESTSFYR